MNNFGEKNLFKKKNVDSRQVELLKHASATLGSGNIREAVRLPEGEDVNEWIAVNSRNFFELCIIFLVVDFFNQISMLYGTISESCTETKCPKMTAGPKNEYYWSDGKNNPINYPAPIYIDYLMTWVQDELDDENIFPSQIGKQFPPNFSHITQTIMKRLFRVYAHIYNQHFELIEQLKAIEHLNTSFKHFIQFVREFNLIDSKQLSPLEDLIQKLSPPEIQKQQSLN